MDHQQWTPIIFTNKNTNKETTTVPKQNINKNPNTIKTKKIYDPDNPNAEPDIRPVLINAEFGKKIAEARCVKKLNQKDLAVATNIPVSVINEYERGQGVYNSTYVNKLKKYLNLYS